MRASLAPLSGVVLATSVLVFPTPAQAGGAWTTPEGTLWGKIAFVYQRSDQQFADPISSLMVACGTAISPGDRMPFDCTTGGTFEVSALYADLFFGIVDGVDVRLQVPVILSQSFWNDSGLNAQQDVALGDLRFGGQFRLLDDPFLIGLRWELKAPTGHFTTDEGIPAVGEGQWDLTTTAAVSYGFDRAWLNGEVGWRFRFPNPETEIDTGDELVVLVEGGYRFTDWLMVSAQARAYLRARVRQPLRARPSAQPVGAQRARQRHPRVRGDTSARVRGRDPRAGRRSGLSEPAGAFDRRVGRGRPLRPVTSLVSGHTAPAVSHLRDCTDEELMAAYVAGNAEAHRELFDRLSPLLLAITRRHLRDETDAEDVVQRTFLSMHRARHDFRPGAKLRPWVFTIAMNLVRDTFRTRKRQRESPIDDRVRHLAAPAGRDHLEQAQEAQRLRAALAVLPPDQRRAIELHWFEERPFAEIADIVGASVSAVKVRAHRGYKKMRAWLESARQNEKPRSSPGVSN